MKTRTIYDGRGRVVKNLTFRSSKEDLGKGPLDGLSAHEIERLHASIRHTQSLKKEEARIRAEEVSEIEIPLPQLKRMMGK